MQGRCSSTALGESAALQLLRWPSSWSKKGSHWWRLWRLCAGTETSSQMLDFWTSSVSWTHPYSRSRAHNAKKGTVSELTLSVQMKSSWWLHLGGFGHSHLKWIKAPCNPTWLDGILLSLVKRYISIHNSTLKHTTCRAQSRTDRQMFCQVSDQHRQSACQKGFVNTKIKLAES